MVHTKNTARKQHIGLPKARFPVVPTSHSERDLHYQTQLQHPSEADEADWTTLTPTLTGTESPEVGRAVDRINNEHANFPPQTINDVCDLVQDLQAHPPTSRVEDPFTQLDCELPHLPSDEPVATTSSPPTWYTDWQRLCDPPCSWPGGPQLLQLQLEVCPTPPPHCCNQVPQERSSRE